MYKPLAFAAALLTAIGLVAAAPSPAEAKNKVVPTSRAQVQLSFAPLVKAAAPAVVNIFTRTKVRQRRVSPLFDDPERCQVVDKTPRYSHRLHQILDKVPTFINCTPSVQPAMTWFSANEAGSPRE